MGLNGTHFTGLCPAVAPLRAACGMRFGGVSGVWWGHSQATRKFRRNTDLRKYIEGLKLTPLNPANPANGDLAPALGRIAASSPLRPGLRLADMDYPALPVTMPGFAARPRRRRYPRGAASPLRIECRRTTQHVSDGLRYAHSNLDARQ
jgi:hypothetical protein